MKNTIKKRIFVFVMLICCISGMFAQVMAIKDKSIFKNTNLSSKNNKTETEEVVVKETFIPNAQMAMSSPDYLVTAGDVYTLAFAMGTTPVSYTMTVDSSYKIRVANLGIVNAKGLSFLQLKSQVEAIVSKNYPMGGVQFVLVSPAMFNVKVSGDVSSSTESPAWALSRLSSVVVPLFTDYSSSRDIQVISADGTKKVYDLFLAERNGDFSNDPYLRPGDNIIVSEAKRKVRIDGAVKRPGVYELLDGENLKALVEKYGDGLTPYADTSRIDLLRINNEPEAGKMYYFKDDAIKSDIAVDSFD